MATVISIVNKKGGTGKTTSAINIAKGLSMSNKRVLLIDLDPQGNLSYSMAVYAEECVVGDAIYRKEIDPTLICVREGISIIPSNDDLINYEVEFLKQEFPFTHLKELVSGLDYDYIIIDCPPSVSYLTVSALIASDYAIVPMMMDVLSLQGLQQILKSIDEVCRLYNPNLRVLGVLGVMVDERRQLTYSVLEYVRNNFDVNVFNNYVRSGVRAAEAPSHGVSVIEYAPKATCSVDYLNVTKEMLKILEN